jgi:hypothetical protein
LLALLLYQCGVDPKQMKLDHHVCTRSLIIPCLLLHHRLFLLWCCVTVLRPPPLLQRLQRALVVLLLLPHLHEQHDTLFHGQLLRHN